MMISLCRGKRTLPGFVDVHLEALISRKVPSKDFGFSGNIPDRGSIDLGWIVRTFDVAVPDDAAQRSRVRTACAPCFYDRVLFWLEDLEKPDVLNQDRVPHTVKGGQVLPNVERAVGVGGQVDGGVVAVNAVAVQVFEHDDLLVSGEADASWFC